MSRRTQLTTKYMFQVLAQLSENFIFIYLGLTLFTERELEFKPLFIIVTVVGICAARWCAVFPISKAINWFIRYRAKRRGKDVADELPASYQAMIFWAGLRGAVGVALAAGLSGVNGAALKATVLVVVVLTVIIFGGTTARMLEILGIRTGVVEEIDSDDEFDIEVATGGTYYKRTGNAVGHKPQRSGLSPVPLDNVDNRTNGSTRGHGFSSSNSSHSPPVRPTSALAGRKNSIINQRERDATEQDLLTRGDSQSTDEEDLYSDSDLPPAAPQRSPKRKPSPPHGAGQRAASAPSIYPTSGTAGSTTPSGSHMTASGAISSIFSATTEDHAAWFKQLDEGFIKPKLLLDQSSKGNGSGSGGYSGAA